MTSSEDRELIASAVDADPCHRIIITHGTDTMPETAAHLIARDVVKKKTVVLTGALLPALFAATDAIFQHRLCPSGAVQSLPRRLYRHERPYLRRCQSTQKPRRGPIRRDLASPGSRF
ncbi:MAG: asparaginase [Desulforhopalus sp.]|nr:asparaginase [Desulforhopalus sp.]